SSISVLLVPSCGPRGGGDLARREGRGDGCGRPARSQRGPADRLCVRRRRDHPEGSRRAGPEGDGSKEREVGAVLVKLSLYRLHLTVRYAAGSLPYYKDLLGYLEYRVIHEEPSVAGFSNGTTDFWLIATDVAHAANGFHRKRVGINHVAFWVARREDVD